jgi:multicomponent Na+:H+ antiporter subunit G
MGLACTLRTWAAVTTLVFVGATQFFTSPVTAQLVGRSAYRHRNVRTELLIVDELSQALARDNDGDDGETGDTSGNGSAADPQQPLHP